MKITLKDGSSKEYAGAMTILDIAKDISEGLARAACAGLVNGKVMVINPHPVIPLFPQSVISSFMASAKRKA